MKPPMNAQNMKANTAEIRVLRNTGERCQWNSSIKWNVLVVLKYTHCWGDPTWTVKNWP